MKEYEEVIIFSFKKELKKFSCEDLRMIDREWLAASGGKFGFSVQLAIYKRTGNSIGSYNDKAYSRFGDAVGWRANGIWKSSDELTLGTNASSIAPEGHLPAAVWPTGDRGLLGLSRLYMDREEGGWLWWRLSECSL